MSFEGTEDRVKLWRVSIYIDIFEYMIGACLSSKADSVVVRDEGSCFVVSSEL